MITLSIDNNEPVTIDEFFKVNAEPNVDPLTKEDIESVQRLEIDETVFIGMVTVKRIS